MEFVVAWRPLFPVAAFSVSTALYLDVRYIVVV